MLVTIDKTAYRNGIRVIELRTRLFGTKLSLTHARNNKTHADKVITVYTRTTFIKFKTSGITTRNTGVR